MKRSALILFDLAATVSLLLCVLSAALWVRGYFVGRKIGWDDQWGFRSMAVARGELCICIVRTDLPVSAGPEQGWFAEDAPSFEPHAVAAWYCPGARPPVAGFFFGRGCSPAGTRRRRWSFFRCPSLSASWPLSLWPT